jgi:hypothetical protein
MSLEQDHFVLNTKFIYLVSFERDCLRFLHCFRFHFDLGVSGYTWVKVRIGGMKGQNPFQASRTANHEDSNLDCLDIAKLGTTSTAFREGTLVSFTKVVDWHGSFFNSH